MCVIPTVGIRGEIRYQSVTECTYPGTRKGARRSRCADGRWLREIAVCGLHNKFPKRPQWCVHEYSKCGQNGHAGKMAPLVNILALRMILKSNYTEMTAVHQQQDLGTTLNI